VAALFLPGKEQIRMELKLVLTEEASVAQSILKSVLVDSILQWQGLPSC